MRNITSIFVIATLTALFISCGDDEVGPLVGTWTLVKEIYADCNDTDPETYIYDCAVSIDECIKYTFTKDGKFSISFSATGLIEGTYSSSGNQIIITLNNYQQSNIFYTYTLSGSTLTLKQEYDGCDIKKTFNKS